MAKMRPAVAAAQLDPAHTVAEIGALLDTGDVELGAKTGPATAGVELALGIEERLSAADAVVDTPVPALIVLAAEGPLGGGLARHPILIGG